MNTFTVFMDLGLSMNTGTAQGLHSRILVHSESIFVIVQREVHSHTNTFGEQQNRLSSMDFHLEQSWPADSLLLTIVAGHTGGRRES